MEASLAIQPSKYALASVSICPGKEVVVQIVILRVRIAATSPLRRARAKETNDAPVVTRACLVRKPFFDRPLSAAPRGGSKLACDSDPSVRAATERLHCGGRSHIGDRRSTPAASTLLGTYRTRRLRQQAPGATAHMHHGTHHDLQVSLTHLRLPPDPPSLARARASPHSWEQCDTRSVASRRTFRHRRSTVNAPAPTGRGSRTGRVRQVHARERRRVDALRVEHDQVAACCAHRRRSRAGSLRLRRRAGRRGHEDQLVAAFAGGECVLLRRAARMVVLEQAARAAGGVAARVAQVQRIAVAVGAGRCGAHRSAGTRARGRRALARARAAPRSMRKRCSAGSASNAVVAPSHSLRIAHDVEHDAARRLRTRSSRGTRSTDRSRTSARGVAAAARHDAEARARAVVPAERKRIAATSARSSRNTIGRSMNTTCVA